MTLRNTTRRRLIAAGVFAGVLVAGSVTAWWIYRATRRDVRPAPSRTATDPAALDVIAAWRKGRGMLGAGDLAGARKVGEAIIRADPQAREGHRLLVQWSFAAMAARMHSAGFDQAVDVCLTQADWLAAAGYTAESELIRACCANARGVRVERTADGAQAAGHFARARLHAEAALAADPQMKAARDLLRRLGAA